MFKRLTYENWHYAVPIIAFLLTFGVFVYFVIRAIRMRRSKADYMSHLPLQDDEIHPPTEGQKNDE